MIGKAPRWIPILVAVLSAINYAGVRQASALQAVLTTKGGGITVLAYSPAADQNAFVVRADTAAQFNLTKMSDLTAILDKLKFGVATDCDTNPVCGTALKAAY